MNEADFIACYCSVLFRALQAALGGWLQAAQQLLCDTMLQVQQVWLRLFDQLHCSGLLAAASICGATLHLLQSS